MLPVFARITNPGALARVNRKALDVFNEFCIVLEDLLQDPRFRMYEKVQITSDEMEPRVSQHGVEVKINCCFIPLNREITYLESADILLHVNGDQVMSKKCACFGFEAWKGSVKVVALNVATDVVTFLEKRRFSKARRHPSR